MMLICPFLAPSHRLKAEAEKKAAEEAAQKAAEEERQRRLEDGEEGVEGAEPAEAGETYVQARIYFLVAHSF